MSYYESLEHDLERAQQILDEGRMQESELPAELPDWLKKHMVGQSGTIYGKDTYAAYKLLESFVGEIRRLHRQLGELEKEMRDYCGFEGDPSEMWADKVKELLTK